MKFVDVWVDEMRKAGRMEEKIQAALRRARTINPETFNRTLNEDEAEVVRESVRSFFEREWSQEELDEIASTYERQAAERAGNN